MIPLLCSEKRRYTRRWKRLWPTMPLPIVFLLWKCTCLVWEPTCTKIALCPRGGGVALWQSARVLRAVFHRGFVRYLLVVAPYAGYMGAVHIAPQLLPCVLSDICGDEMALALLKKIIGYYTLSDAIFMQGLTYTTSEIILQWEQLPWQKSILLSDTQFKPLKEGFLERAQGHRYLLLQYIKAYPNLFPCYQGEPIIQRNL